jgi:chromosome segregation ATPase
MAEAEAAEKRAGEAESEANAMVERLARLAGVGNDGAANLVAAGDALARVEDRVRQLGEALEVSQHEADMLRAQLDTMVSAEEVESLQNRLDEQEDIVSQICEEVAEYQQELDFLRAESERQRAASAAHAARAAALEGAAAEAAEFKALNDQLSGHMDELVTAMEERNASNKRLREKLAALPDLNEVEALREGLSRAEERAAQLSREVEVATSVADNLRSREAEAADEANRLTNDLAAAKLREEELEELVAALEDENPSATPARGRGEGQLRQRLDHLERELGREQAANEEVSTTFGLYSDKIGAASESDGTKSFGLTVLLCDTPPPTGSLNAAG